MEWKVENGKWKIKENFPEGNLQVNCDFALAKFPSLSIVNSQFSITQKRRDFEVKSRSAKASLYFVQQSEQHAKKMKFGINEENRRFSTLKVL